MDTVIERSLACFSCFHRLTTRYEELRLDIFEAFHHLTADLICWRFVRRFCWAL